LSVLENKSLCLCGHSLFLDKLHSSSYALFSLHALGIKKPDPTLIVYNFHLLSSHDHSVDIQEKTF